MAPLAENALSRYDIQGATIGEKTFSGTIYRTLNRQVILQTNRVVFLTVRYKDKKSDAIDVKFTLIDNTLFGVDKPVSIVIWTTTPWTLPANEAVALHPELAVCTAPVPASIVTCSPKITGTCLS
jgi:hypothetical protein